MNPALVADLRSVLGDARVRAGDTELALDRRDASNIEGAPGVVCFPQTTEEVQGVVKAAVAHATPFVARGAGTGLA